jgi:hypothetical protein
MPLNRCHSGICIAERELSVSLCVLSAPVVKEVPLTRDVALAPYRLLVLVCLHRKLLERHLTSISAHSLRMTN